MAVLNKTLCPDAFLLNRESFNWPHEIFDVLCRIHCKILEAKEFSLHRLHTKYFASHKLRNVRGKII